jgi:molybdopterin-guanine dinucleotide biosynthesis protein B
VNRFHIVGRKNSGKTTLVVELVSHLSAQGHRVGTVKHTHHHHELDTPGKDSYRHRDAGAAVVGILAPEMSAVFQPHDTMDDVNSGDVVSGDVISGDVISGDRGRDEKAARYEWLAATMTDCDIVIVEGDLHTGAPKLEVWRAANSERPIAASDRSISLVVTDDEAEATEACNAQVPIHPRRDVAGLAEKIMAQLARG